MLRVNMLALTIYIIVKIRKWSLDGTLSEPIIGEASEQVSSDGGTT